MRKSEHLCPLFTLSNNWPELSSRCPFRYHMVISAVEKNSGATGYTALYIWVVGYGQGKSD